MKKIKLHGKYAISDFEFALVDDIDFEYLNQYKWSVCKNGIVLREITNSNKKIVILMHRMIMLPDASQVVDHIDHNRVNNQRANLRNCTSAQNSKNTSSRKNSASKYVDVSISRKKRFSKTLNKIVVHEYWMAEIYVDNKRYYLGKFPHTIQGEIKAAKIRDEAAKKYHGEFANLNFKE